MAPRPGLLALIASSWLAALAVALAAGAAAADEAPFGAAPSLRFSPAQDSAKPKPISWQEQVDKANALVGELTRPEPQRVGLCVLDTGFTANRHTTAVALGRAVNLYRRGQDFFGSGDHAYESLLWKPGLADHLKRLEGEHQKLKAAGKKSDLDAASDEGGHGTKSAYAAAAVAFDKTTIYPIKVAIVLSGGEMRWHPADLVAGVEWCLMLREKETHIRVISLSLGIQDMAKAYRDEESRHRVTRAVDKALERAKKAGLLVVAAAGNEAGPVAFPANSEHALAVAASKDDGASSNLARGKEIVFTAPERLHVVAKGVEAWTGKGTSIAAPRVAGQAAFYLSLRPAAEAAEVVAAMIASSRLSDPKDKNLLKTEKQDGPQAPRTARQGYGWIDTAELARLALQKATD